MKRRILALFLVLIMLVSLMPASVLAAEVTPETPTSDMAAGDTFRADSADAELPDTPEGLEWYGPEREVTCTTEEHEHSARGRDGCYSGNCDNRSPGHSHCYSDSCTNTDERHQHCFTLTCGKSEHSHSEEAGCYGGYVWTLSYVSTSTITFRIVNGTWSGLNLGSDATLSADGTEVTFTVTYWDPYGYVYKCGGAMESFLNSVLGNDNSLGSAYIVPDEGYTLEGMTSQDWEVISGGLTGSGASANEQMEQIKADVHAYDDHMTPGGGFIANTVYVLTLTKDGYTYTGTIDNGGTVNGESGYFAESDLSYGGESPAMVFVPAANYEIVSVSVSVNKGSAVSYAAYAGADYSLGEDGSFTFPAETVTHDIDVVVTTALKTFTVTWLNYDGSQLELDSNVPYGSEPEYNGETPVKPSDAQYDYVFAGWTPSISPVTGDAVYTAVFVPSGTRSYTVTWLNHNGVELEVDYNVPYGAAPEYNGAVPTKDADSRYTYEFVGWDLYIPDDGDETADDLSLVTVTGNMSFIAVFRPVEIQRTATVEVILNGVADESLETISGGSHVSISAMVPGAENALCLSADGSSFILLEEGSTGIYSKAGVANGDYGIYAKVGGEYVRIGTQILTINNADRARYLPYYSVSYSDGEANGAAANMPAAAYYYIGSHVDVSSLVPEWEGHIFLCWEENGTQYQPSDELEVSHLDTSITSPHVLTALWQGAASVELTVVVDHTDRPLANVTESLSYAVTVGSGGVYNELAGSGAAVGAAVWMASTAGGVSTYFAGSWSGLSADYDYSGTASVPGYKHVRTDVVKDGDSYKVTVYLEYDPAGFELSFDVLVDASTPRRLVPAEVDVRVTYWNGSTWLPISEHANATASVSIGTDTVSVAGADYYYGTGSVHVDAFINGSSPYLYRIELVRMDLGDYQLSMDAGSDRPWEDYYSQQYLFFPAGAYYGYVVVEGDCANGLTSGGLYGAHAYADGDGYIQHESITAFISVELYDIELLLNYDNGDESDVYAQITQRLTVPALDAWGSPTREGYTFAGWYTRDGSGGDWGDEISGGEYILSYVEELGGTLSLYARWNKNFTVQGSVVIDLGFPCTDTSRTVMVALQWRAADGTVYVTQREQTVSLLPVEGQAIAVGEYKFEDVANIGDYRVYVIVPDGGTITYQNEPVSLDASKLYSKDAYNDADYTVIDSNADDVAVVNIYMDAKDFELGYMVDASRIGASFRPGLVNLDLRHDHSDGSYETLTTLPGIDELDEAGLSGMFTIAVPPYHANGYLYNYVISTVSWAVPAVNGGALTEHHHYLGDAAAQKSFAPFTIRYTGPANYSESANSDGLYQDVTLVAIFEPNSYAVEYDLAGGSWEEGFVPVGSHTWSFDTDLGDPVPVREGYVFMGWTANNEENYADGVIPARVWEDVTLTANWEVDKIGPGGGSDGVPDKYQVEIFYVADEGGSIAEGAAAYEVITLYTADGEYAESGSISLSGSAAEAAEDYVFDGWSSADYELSQTQKQSAVLEGFTIAEARGGEKYTFTAAFAEDKKGSTDPDDPDPSDGIADKYQVFVEFYSADENGTVTGSGILQTFTFSPETSGDVDPDMSNVEVTPAPGYALDIWTRDSLARDNAPVNPDEVLYNVPGGTTIRFYAHFAEDKLDDPGDGTEGGDGIPDKYQALVTYVVKNGHWSDGSQDDIYAVFTLYVKNADTGAWEHVFPVPTLAGTIPTGMYPDAAHTGEGYWDVTPTDDTMVMGNAVYTYTFPIAAAPAVDIEKSVDKTSAVVGETVTYTITVTNTGNCALGELVVTESFSGNIAGAKVTLPEGVSETAPGVYLIAALSIDETVTITIEYVVAESDVENGLSNAVAVESRDKYDPTPDVPGDEPEPVRDEDETPDVPVTERRPGLNVTKTADKTTAAVGETITWTVTVTNTGNVKLLDISLSDTLYADGEVLTALELKDAEGNAVSLIAELDAGETVTLYAEYTVTESDQGKTIKNVAAASTPEGPGDEGESGGTEVPVPVSPPDEPSIPELNKEDHVAYIIGYPDGTVRPGDNITRAEVATIFFRLLTDGSRAQYWSQSNPYSDVSIDNWFNNAISTLYNAGILTGYPDGSFKPNEYITRAEFAAIAARFSEVVYNGGNSFTDIPENHWAARYIALAEHLGWVNGYPDSSFKPDQAITRAEAMTLVNRVLERAVEAEHMLPDMVTWVDNVPGSWYYEAVQEATNSHAYVRTETIVPGLDFCYEDWLQILPVPDWAALEKSWSSAYDHI